ncbi:folylpolyglutamate synthase, mitochondrial-like isoform X2 [Corticium candelabrum]|uniref:folylpolyglutamate synthase, mitochondrial-like isoform X2 n=1 Tax=Corticium candelabrum TaxID=121492 RepID=UPI002E25B132|nr:folylpolyglutamate synthase, mitochondrial-like isoform X2 [Corticium candelabrum]
MKNTYEEAIRTLNGLQSSTAEKRNRELTRGDAQQEEKIVQMEEIMKRLGVKMGDVDRLRVIHVSGTKGKGSTCAFCESILHHCGYRTGLFTSPHLVEVRDRFHVNGRRLTKDQFSMYFWKCYELLEETRDHYNGFMPTYFKFLTGMGLYLFIQEKVEVAIIEVGIGGAYDCTNVVKHPSVCGVASLGYDHTRILGDTIESIAWHKAGILKKCVPAFTVNQEVGGMNILCERAAEIGAVLSVAPDLSCYPGPLPDLGLSGKYQETNATLALQLCNTWIQMNRKRPYNCHHDGMPSSIGTEANAITTAPVFDITKEFRLGLRNCWWPGRSQMISRPGWTLFVDGAHTVASTKACMEWFSQASTEDEKDRDCSVTRILIFHCTGGRIARPLLKQIQGVKLHKWQM